MDLSPSPGGSVISLYHLASHIDRTRFQPLVVLPADNIFTRFEQAGVPVERVRMPQWERHAAGGTVERLRAGKLGDEMRHHPARARLWHFLGGLRRLQRNVLPVVPPLIRIIREFQPDLVHLNTGIPLIREGLIAARLTRVPAICHCRTFATPTADDNRWLVPSLLGLIFISKAVADAHLAAIPRPPRYQVIPNALDLAEFAQPVDRAAVRASLGVPMDVPLIGMAGRIAPWKGQDVFIDALAALNQRLPPVHGLIVGLVEEADGPGFGDRLREQVATLGLGDRVHFVGFRNDVPQVLAATDVVVHCSVKPEPFGRVVIEGMAAGRPVVASKAGGPLEIITDGVNGLLVPPGDPAPLAQALAGLLSNPAEATRLAAAARQTAFQRYGIGAHVAVVQAFYNQVIDRVANA